MTFVRSAGCLLAAAILLPSGCGGGSDRVEVPDLRGVQADDARLTLEDAGLRARGPGGRRRVASQDPAPGTAARASSAVRFAVQPPGTAPGDVPSGSTAYRVSRYRARATRDPRTVVLRFRAPPARCFAIAGVETSITGRVAWATVVLRHRGVSCDERAIATRRARAGFEEPVGHRVVLAAGNVTLPRPADDASPESWSRAILSPDRRTVAVEWLGGVAACDALERVDVEEGDEEVTITVRTGWPKGTPRDQACIALGVQRVAIVRLKAPLGDRKLVDGAD